MNQMAPSLVKANFAKNNKQTWHRLYSSANSQADLLSWHRSQKGFSYFRISSISTPPSSPGRTWFPYWAAHDVSSDPLVPSLVSVNVDISAPLSVDTSTRVFLLCKDDCYTDERLIEPKNPLIDPANTHQCF
jgi:hypothetical protein